MKNQSTVSVILKAIALAMGVAAFVLGILGNVSPGGLATALGLGLFCLALWALRKGD
jgi:hypothetical protein